MTKFGIDWTQFRALTRLYYWMATRGAITPALRRRGKSVHPVWGLLFFGLLGSSFGAVVFMPGIDMFMYGLYVHTITFIMAGMVCILESAAIMFNPIEEDLLGHRPIAPRTLVAAKMLNLMAMTFLLAAALNAVPSLSAVHIKGVAWWTPAGHFCALLWEVLFNVSLVVLGFRFALQRLGQQKMKILLTWAQIVMVIFIMMASQVLPRLITPLIQSQTAMPHAAWLKYLPPAWFAALGAMLSGSAGAVSRLADGAHLRQMALIGLLAPPYLAWSAIRRLGTVQQDVARGMAEKGERATQNLDDQSSTAFAANPAKLAKPARPLNFFLRWWMRDPVERASFRLVATYMRRDGQVMQALYPQLAYLVIYPLVMAFSNAQAGSLMFLGFGSWMLCSLPMTALSVLACSEHCAAAEIFAVTPLQRPGALFQGARKAALYFLGLPGMVLIFSVFAFISHNRLHDLSIILPIIFLMPTLSLFPAMDDEVWMPFAQPPRQGRQPMRGVVVMTTMMGAVAVGGASYFLSKIGYLWALYVVEIPLLLVLNAGMLKYIAKPRAMRIEDGV